MASKTSTRVPLIFAFIITFLGTLVIMTLGRSEGGAGALSYLPYILFGILGYTVHKRLMEKGEKPAPGSVIMAVILLMIPLVNLFILTDLLGNKKKSHFHESDDEKEDKIQE